MEMFVNRTFWKIGSTGNTCWGAGGGLSRPAALMYPCMSFIYPAPIGHLPVPNPSPPVPVCPCLPWPVPCRAQPAQAASGGFLARQHHHQCQEVGSWLQAQRRGSCWVRLLPPGVRADAAALSTQLKSDSRRSLHHICLFLVYSSYNTVIFKNHF